MKRLFTSCFGLGWLPLAPGTWGSLPPVIIFAVLCSLRVTGVTVAILMAGLAVAGAVICLKFAPEVIAATGQTDPAEVVVDEFAGQSIALVPLSFLLPQSASPGQILTISLAGFAVFRVFDIVKPWPIRRLEKLPAGWGILADDLLAGVFAAIFVMLLSQLVSCRSCPFS